MVDLRILVLNWRDIKNPRAGGAEVAVENIANALAQSGHNITVFTSAYKNSKKEEKTSYGKIIRRGSINTVYIHAFLYYTKHHKDFDAILESVSSVPFFTPLYAHNKKLIIIPHHIMGKTIFKEIPLPNAIIAYSAEGLIPLVYRDTNFVVPSKAVGEDFKDLGVHPELVTTSYFNTVLPGFKAMPVKKYKKPTIITVARLMKYKRVDLLLEILKEIVKKVDVDLIIVGSGKEENTLKEKAKQLGISRNVKFTGHISEMKKAEFLARSWIFVTTSEKEGFGISALEAEKCGTPVVAFNNGGLKEVVKDNYSGILIDNMDKKAFEKAIVRLLMDDSLRGRFSANSIAYGNSFNTKKEIQKIEKLLAA